MLLADCIKEGLLCKQISLSVAAWRQCHCLHGQQLFISAINDGLCHRQQHRKERSISDLSEREWQSVRGVHGIQSVNSCIWQRWPMLSVGTCNIYSSRRLILGGNGIQKLLPSAAGLWNVQHSVSGRTGTWRHTANAAGWPHAQQCASGRRGANCRLSGVAT